MVFFGPKLWIELFDEPEYLTGGSVAGTLNIDTKSSLDVMHVDVMLRCRERVSLITLNGSSAYRSGAIWQRLSLRTTVFPSSLVLGSDQDARQSLSQLPDVFVEPEELWRNTLNAQVDSSPPISKFTHTYTLKKGLHKLPFEFVIPKDLPSTLKLDEENGIYWFLEAKMYRQGVLTLQKNTSLPITVWHANMVPWNMSLVDHKTNNFDIKVYSPGYSAVKKQNILDKSLTKSLKEISCVTLHLYSPIDGLLQYPKPLGVSFAMSCPQAQLLLISSIHIYLRRRAYVKSEPGRQQEYSRDIPIVKLDHMNLSFKEAVDKINSELDNASITTKLSESHHSPLITVSYKVTAEVVLISREKVHHTDRIKLSVPVLLHSCMAKVGDEDESEIDELPRYSVH